MSAGHHRRATSTRVRQGGKRLCPVRRPTRVSLTIGYSGDALGEDPWIGSVPTRPVKRPKLARPVGVAWQEQSVRGSDSIAAWMVLLAWRLPTCALAGDLHKRHVISLLARLKVSLERLSSTQPHPAAPSLSARSAVAIRLPSPYSTGQWTPGAPRFPFTLLRTAATCEHILIHTLYNLQLYGKDTLALSTLRKAAQGRTSVHVGLPSSPFIISSSSPIHR
jgi:hypothetical protein